MTDLGESKAVPERLRHDYQKLNRQDETEDYIAQQMEEIGRLEAKLIDSRQEQQDEIDLKSACIAGLQSACDDRVEENKVLRESQAEFVRTSALKLQELGATIREQAQTIERLTQELGIAGRVFAEQSEAARADWVAKVSALQQQVSALRDALKDAQKRVKQCGCDWLTLQAIDAALALTQPPEPAGIKVALAKMSPQLRNVLYDLIRKIPPLADHGDQQAMNEFIAEVKDGTV